MEKVVPETEGTYVGKCAEFCGEYHSGMLFNVKVVSAAEFAKQLKALQDNGNVGLVVGGEDASGGSNQVGQQSESGANE